MLFTGKCLDEKVDSFVGKRGAVVQTLLVLFDVAGERHLGNTVDYVLNEVEDKVHKGKVQDRVVTVNVGEVFVGLNGRLKFRGRILEVK